MTKEQIVVTKKLDNILKAHNWEGGILILAKKDTTATTIIEVISLPNDLQTLQVLTDFLLEATSNAKA